MSVLFEHPDSDVDRSGPIGWMASHPTAANVLMGLLIVGGIILSGRIERRNMPRVQLQEIQVTVPYPGASPSEVEDGVLLAVESALENVDDVRRVESTARQSIGMVTAKLTTSAEPDEALGKVETAVNSIRSFPAAVEEPRFEVPSNRRSVISVAISGEVPLQKLEERGEMLRRRLRRRPEIAKVGWRGLPRREISVELREAVLRKYDITIEQVAAKIRGETRRIPAGEVQTHQGTVLVETSLRNTSAQQIAAVPLFASPDGARIRIGDVARVQRSYGEPELLTHVNGERSVLVDIFTDEAFSPTETVDATKKVVRSVREQTDLSIQYELWGNDARYYQARMRSLASNGIAGFLLVLVVLALFLKPRVGFWTAVGLPTAYFGTLFVMPFWDISLNGISIFAFLVTIGLVVDDAIVVGDAIDVRQDTGIGSLDGAIQGTRSVLRPLTFAVVTTVVAFAPTLFVPGPLGQFLPDIGTVVALVLFFSLVECLFILPAHLGHAAEREPPALARPIIRVQSTTTEFLRIFNERWFQPVVRAAIRYRYVTVTAAVGGLIVAIGLIGAGVVKFSFMPQISRTKVGAALRMPPGTSLDHSKEAAEQLASAAQRASRRLSEDESIIKKRIVIAGRSGLFGGPPMGSHLSEVRLQLRDPETRSVSTKEFSRAWRDEIGEIPGLQNVRFVFETGPAVGPDISLRLVHPDASVLPEASRQLVSTLENYEGLAGIESSAKSGPMKLRLRPTPVARAMGLSAADLANQVRGTFYGSEADRVQQGEDEVRIYVRRPKHNRRTLHTLRSMLISLPNGGEIPLREAARVERSYAEPYIQRTDGRRIARVTANVIAPGQTGANTMARLEDEVFPKLEEQFPNLEISTGGVERQRRRSLSYLAYAYLVALVFIFGLLAIGLDSYLQPLMVLAMIPFGLVGAIAGHLVLGFNLSMVSLFGVVALSGIIVNDTVVLLDAANDRLERQHPVDAIRKRSLQLYEALTEAARMRFRPVVLTSITTFFGVAPLMMERAPSVQLMVPLAISLGFGVLVATVVTLLVLPALHLVAEDISVLFRNLGESVGFRR